MTEPSKPRDSLTPRASTSEPTSETLPVVATELAVVDYLPLFPAQLLFTPFPLPTRPMFIPSTRARTTQLHRLRTEVMIRDSRDGLWSAWEPTFR